MKRKFNGKNGVSEMTIRNNTIKFKGDDIIIDGMNREIINGIMKIKEVTIKIK